MPPDPQPSAPPRSTTKQPARKPKEATASLRPIAKSAFGYDQARRLLLRAGFGGTPEQIRTLAGWGPEKAVDFLLDPAKIPYTDTRLSKFDPSIMQAPDETTREEYRRAQKAGDEETLARLRLRRQDAQRRDRQQAQEMQRWWLARMIESPRPLEEKMTLFWHGHFATSYRKIEQSWNLLQQNRMFREHALGNFGEMLFRIIRDPAMIAYLDNDKSRKERPNENLARELMELFSLGVGAYSEKDIQEGARALTGYTFEGNDFQFREQWHDKSAKQVLGARGPLDGEGFVKAILERPECSRFIAWKMYRFFVRSDIPADLRESPRPAAEAIHALASTMLANRYEIRPVLRQLFLSEHFHDAANASSEIKSPAELVVGAVRSLNTPVRDLAVLNDAMERMGQELFFPPSVKGWEGGRAWINTSTLYIRQNILVYLLTGRTPMGGPNQAVADKYDPTPLLKDLAEASPGAEREPARVVEYLLRLTLGEAREERSAALMDFLKERGAAAGPLSGDMLTALLVLITAMPEYQLA